MALTPTLEETHVSTIYGSSLTSDSFTPDADCLLVVVIAGIPNNNGPTNDPTLSGGGLTYTKQIGYQGSGTYGVYTMIFTAPVGSSPSSQTLGVTFDEQQEYFAVSVYGVVGYDTGSPHGAELGTGGTSRSGAWNGTLDASPATDSYLFIGIENNGGTPTTTLPAEWSADFDTGILGSNRMTFGTRTANTSSTLSIDNLTGTFQWSVSALEIMAAVTGDVPNRRVFVIQYV